MQAIDIAVRAPAGDVQFTSLVSNGQAFALQAEPGQSISLNVSPSSLRGYTRDAGDLVIALADGQTIVIEDYFTAEGARLFLSAGGSLSEVVLTETGDGLLLASYGPTETFGKWSPNDELIFLDTPVAMAGVVTSEDEETSMLATSLLGTTLAGGSGLGVAAGAAAVGAAVLGAEDEDGSGGGASGGSGPIDPSIDDAGESVTIYGDDAQEITVSGIAEPGATVIVTVGGQQIETVAADDASWSVVFDGDAFPEDGSYTVTATVTDPDGRITELNGASYDIDVTAPAVEVQDGTESSGTLVNAEMQAGGITLSGSVEPGSTVTVEIDGTAYDAVVSDGSWTLDLDESVIGAGTYTQSVTVTATDAAGNVTVITDTIVVDTEISLTADTAAMGGDGTINAAERAAGVALTGTSEPGSTVVVTLAGTTRTATVAADGSWSVSYAAADLPEGETTLDVTATATDAAGNSTTTSGSVEIDTLVTDFAHTSTPGGADGVVNATEAAQGLTLTGTTEPGSTVTLSFAGTSVPVTVASDGSWTATVPPSAIPAGEGSYDIIATATDAAGNTETLTQSVTVDTVAGQLTISAAPVEGDDVVNAAEAADGVTLTGTSDPNQLVTVTLGGVSRDVTTDANGVWTATFAPGDIPPGTYEAQITATITDAAGNTLVRTDSVQIDTEVQNFAVSTAPVAGDGVVNAAEAASGVALSGTTEPGSSVLVSVGGVTRPASVDQNGNWTASFAAGEIAPGTYTAQALVSTIDPAGNQTQTAASFLVDTEVDRLAFAAAPIAGDGVVNAAEAAAGLTLTGVVEPGSTLIVTLNGISHAASVDAAGNWSVTIAASDLPAGELDATVTLDATDAAGNTRSESTVLSFDTVIPESPEVTDYTRNHTGLTGVSLEMTDDAIQIGHIEADGSVGAVGFTSFDIAARGETSYFFDETVPDGSHLVVTATDAAGNVAGTLHVVDDPLTNQVGITDALAQTLGAFEIETIDLQFAEDSQLTLTEAQVTALAQGTDTVTITGGVDDTVTITGAQAVGQTTQDGQTFNVFVLGDATVQIEDDITNVVI
ncbi:Ig-like domain (group 3) [Roseivivax lentus]|uniref:Ig-like domain (Group 3) n=1 Tax=Roseivivax lentus TaxID=633194 RepID=A0A1N7M8J0_9RHOB|nr:Ig-like domain-containing protein [Roseivivax lentus]SIS82400.1 Ig-like domain (group 3) [Roseivivax lentus]